MSLVRSMRYTGRGAQLLRSVGHGGRLALCSSVLVILTSCGGGKGDTAAGTSDGPALRGRFIDAPVQGLTYSVNGQRGTTDSQGSFTYASTGDQITFYVGGIEIGTSAAAEVVHVYDLIGGSASLFDSRNLRVAQFLQSIDANRGLTGTILIDPAVLRLAETQALSFDGTQDEFDSNLKAFLSQANLASQFVTKEQAKASADKFLAQALSACPLDQPASPDPNDGNAFAIKVGALTCTDIARINYYRARVAPFISDTINSAVDKLAVVEEAWDEKAAARAIDVNPVIAAFATADSIIDVTNADEKGKSVTAIAGLGKIFLNSANLVSDLFLIARPTDGTAQKEAEAGRARLAVVEKVVDVLSSAEDCKAFIDKVTTADPSACIKVVSDAILTVNKALDPDAFGVKSSVDLTQFRAYIKVLADEIAVAAASVKTIAAIGNGRDAVIKASFSIATSTIKLTKDAITFAFLNKGESVPDTGGWAVAVHVLDDVALPMANVAKNCYGPKVGAAVFTCISSGAQEGGKIAIKAAFASIGVVTTVRNAGHLNVAIVGQAVLEEFLWAGFSNIDAVYKKYGVTYDGSTRRRERDSLFRLIEAIGEKKKGLHGVTTYADFSSILWAAVWNGQNSFSDPAVADLVGTYGSMILANAQPNFKSPSITITGISATPGVISVTVDVDPLAVGISGGELSCTAAASVDKGLDNPWIGQVSGKTRLTWQGRRLWSARCTRRRDLQLTPDSSLATRRS